jgi:hypothetical protein
VQNLGENPERAYRELLMGEDENGNPIPYNAPTGTVIRIPHSMSLGGAVIDARIPDVVIPVPIADMGAFGPPDAIISLLWDPNNALAIPNGPSTGMWVDEDHVYLFIGGSKGSVSFVVYVEYTHSVIRNEIITGAYEYLYGGLGGGRSISSGVLRLLP